MTSDREFTPNATPARSQRFLLGPEFWVWPETTVEEHPWGRLVWLANERIFAGSTETLGYVEIDPGMTNYRQGHPNTEEVLFLLDGRLDHVVGDRTFQVSAGATIHIPKGTAHWATNTGTSVARMIVAYPTGRRETELLTDDETQAASLVWP